MRVIRLARPGAPLREEEVPVPELRAHEALIRVEAAGICHSDAHYRAGTSPVPHLPVTPGHEVAGTVEQLGPGVTGVREGTRVGLHYVVACGECPRCERGTPQFCMSLEMVGRDRDGGYAEFVAVPARNLVPLPDGVSFPHGAVMMCSSATSLHALRKARLQAGESVAVFGTGGLGMSAIQLAGAFGAEPIFAADIDPVKLAAAERLGAIPVNAAGGDPVGMIRSATGGRGVDVAVELTGLPAVTRQAIDSAAILGRVALTGISNRGVEVYPYRELIGKELELIGVSDHHLSELTELVGLAEKGTLDLSDVVTRTIPLDGEAVNLALTLLDRFEAGIRTVILPREGR